MNQAIVDDVKAILHEARGQAYTAINSAMVQAYWLVGKRIVEEEQGGEAKAKYGEAVLKEFQNHCLAIWVKVFPMRICEILDNSILRTLTNRFVTHCVAN